MSDGNLGQPQSPDPQKSRDQYLGFFALLREITWSFLGVRSKKGYEETFAKARPRDIVLVGILATLVFILVLVSIARFAIGLATQ